MEQMVFQKIRRLSWEKRQDFTPGSCCREDSGGVCVGGRAGGGGCYRQQGRAWISSMLCLFGKPGTEGRERAGRCSKWGNKSKGGGFENF